MVNSFSNLKFKIFSPNFVETDVANQCFNLWNTIWSSTFRELDGVEKIFSDDFSRQDEVIALYMDNKPIALIMHRYCDFEKLFNMDDSYFKIWSFEDINQLFKTGKKIVIGSQISIDPSFRKSSFMQLSVKNLIVYKSLSHLKENKNIDAITGVMRADKGMHTLFYNSGAVSIRAGVMAHHVPVDLVAFFPKIKEIIIPEDYIKQIAIITNNKESIYEHKRVS